MWVNVHGDLWVSSILVSSTSIDYFSNSCSSFVTSSWSSPFIDVVGCLDLNHNSNQCWISIVLFLLHSCISKETFTFFFLYICTNMMWGISRCFVFYIGFLIPIFYESLYHPRTSYIGKTTLLSI